MTPLVVKNNLRTLSAWRIASLIATFAVSCGFPRSSGELSSLAALPSKESTTQAPHGLTPTQDAPAEGVVLQAFNWPFELVTERLPELAAIGYTHIHISPPNLTIERNEWWARYQPLDYRVIDGPLGDEQSFLKLNEKADVLDIKIIADVVLNHMANPDFAYYNERYTDNPESLVYPTPAASRKYGLAPLFGVDDFNATGCIEDYNNRKQVVDNRLCLGFPDKGLPDLNLDRPQVINAQRSFLRKLVDLGVDGFRIDALKHMPPAIISKLFDGFDFSSTLMIGEIIAGPEDMHQMEPYLSTSEISLYDFPRLFLMREAFRPEGSLRRLVRPEDLGLALQGERAVTFVVNHDIPNNGDIFRWLEFYDKAEEHLAYAYILAQDTGLAYVYSDLGRSGGLDSDRYLDAYRDPVIVKQIDFRKRVAGSRQRFLWESDNVLAWSRGTNALIVLNKSGTDSFPIANLELTELSNGRYRDAITGAEFTIRHGEVLEERFVIAPRSAALFMIEI